MERHAHGGGPLTDLLVDTREATALVESGATVLDTRSAFSWLRGHVPGAVRVDWRIGTTGGLTSGRLDTPAVVAAAYAALGVRRSRPVLVVGDWDEGWGEEGRVAWNLAWLGHTDVHVLEGGMDAWPGPWEHLGATPTPGDFTAQPVASLRADLRADAGAPFVIDVRDPDEFAGARRHREARGGHIPGATNLPWRTLMDGGPAVPKDTPIVVYCTGGVRSGMAWLLLTAQGFTHVANDDGSWWDYARSDKPAATR